MPWPEIHGALTHFPVALLITACVFDVAAVLLHKPQGRMISFWLLVAAVVMAVPSLVAGWMTGDQLFAPKGHPAPQPPGIFVLHRGAAFATSGIALALLAWRVKARDQFTGGALAASVVLMCLAGAGASCTGFLGGRMLFGSQAQMTGHGHQEGGAEHGDGAHGGGAHGEEHPARATSEEQKPDPTLVKTGEQLFQSNGCTGCHRMNGVGARVGPDLTHEGEHQPDPQWQIEHLKNPAKMSPGSIMPSFAKLKPDEVKALAAYLVTSRENKQ